MRISMAVVRMPDIRKLSKKALARVDEGLNQAAIRATELILDRTARGMGVEGRFKAYSASYEKRKLKRGHSATPNLFYSGNMLGAMAIRNGKDYAEIYFRGAVENKKAAFNNELRPFFALNDDEMKDIAAVFKQYVGF